MRIFIAFIAVAILTACSSKEENTTTEQTPSKEANVWVNGKILNAANKSIKLVVTLQQGLVTLGETTLDNEGKFELAAAINGLGIYQLQLENSNAKVLPLPLNVNDKLTINADYATFERLPELSGTSWSKTVTTFFTYFNDFANKQQNIAMNNTLSEDDKLKELFKLRKPLDDFSIRSITETPGSEANLLFVTSLTPAMGFQYWDEKNLEPLKMMATAYQEKFPESPFANSLARQYAQIEQGYKEYLEYSKNAPKVASTNETAPNIALPNPNGKTMSLAALRGKYVLIDFWASWCGPCRKENPNVVALYDKYKSKNFEIFSVSLDQDANAWKRAIESDNLKWSYHVSDLKQWDSSVIPLYGIQSIPYTVLIDPKGKIIAINLRGEALVQKLKELFN